MSKPKWYNWVGDPIWDEYCKYAWIFVFGPIFSVVLFLIAAGIVEAIW